MVEANRGSRAAANLQRRVEALEAALRARSRQLVLLLDQMPPELYWIAERILSGRPLPLRLAPQPEDWRESTDLLPADVEEVLVDLWSAAGPPGAEGTP